ncbi:hypothetical protein [uncultured Microbacterium sp.]|uniref:hypothetical protein n=1 Tax=uncultured Microbacterium sp. TaxID=191216 RepID=UPI0025E591A5|nr:hypothetical protein [uncultured Microbacterium sp.]
MTVLRRTVDTPLPLMPAAAVTHSTRSVRRGEIIQVTRGVYASRDAWQTLPPWQQYLARVRAHLLNAPDDVLCLESAAALHGLPVLGAAYDIHVLGSASATARSAGGVRVHTSAHPDRVIEEVDGIRLTSVADTCIDVARTRHPAIALAVADAAARVDERCTALTLVTLNEERASARGRRRARWALHRVDPAAESPLESLSRAVTEWAGFAEPERQVWFGSPAGGGDRVDLWWPQLRIAGEADGLLKYDGRFGDPRVAMKKREDRDRRLRAAGARAVLHWGWDDLTDPNSLIGMLSGAGLPVVASPDTANLHSLAAALRPPRPR